MLIKYWVFKAIGDILYHLNGRLAGLHRENRRYRLMIAAWSIAYYEGEKLAGRVAPEH